MQAEAEERMRQEAKRAAAASAATAALEAPQLQAQDLSSLTQRGAPMEASDGELALPRQPQGEAVAS